MAKKSTVILPLAAALAALGAGANDSKATPQEPQTASGLETQSKATKQAPNAFFSAGEELLGLVVTKAAGGKVLAAHSSHASHAPHASHASSAY